MAEGKCFGVSACHTCLSSMNPIQHVDLLGNSFLQVFESLKFVSLTEFILSFCFLFRTMAEDEILFDDVYTIHDVIGK